MKYGFDVFAFVGKKNGKDIYEWKAVHPTGGQPYRYDTREEAERMARICYGSDPSIVRVTEHN